MRIIFSRKGFDSKYRGVPSPIFPDGTVAPFPIPSSAGRPLQEVSAGEFSLATIVADLTAGRISRTTSVHLDPDLNHLSVPRKEGWRPNLGQVGSAQKHLVNQRVGPGDVFLFFGWYRAVDRVGGRWQYKKGAPDIHSLFGWLEVGEVLAVGSAKEVSDKNPWLEDHPHVRYATKLSANNTIYVAPGDTNKQRTLGGGVFSRWSPALQLTQPGSSRSIWSIPGWMAPSSEIPPMSFHAAKHRWEKSGDRVRLRSAAIGQEFVLSVGSSAQAANWLEGLINSHR